MSETEFKSEWLKELESPDTRDEAAAKIFTSYAEDLLQLIRRNLSDHLSSRIDADDILQSVWGSFFRRSFNCKDSKSLFALLAQLCINKTRSAARFHGRLRRSVSAEAEIEVDKLSAHHAHDRRKTRATSAKAPPAQGHVHAEDDSWLDVETLQLMARGANPEQAAIVIEVFEGLPEELQQILSWRLEDMTESEIAERLGCTRRTITRRLGLLREHLRNLGGDMNDT